jgi:hydrogenase maturation protease
MTTVLGIGNEAMGDDAVGVVVAREQAARAPRLPAEVVEGGMAGMGLIRHFLTPGTVIVIDAIDTGAEPGDIFRFDPDEAGVTALRCNNIHGMGVPHLVANARLMGARPNVVVYAVQVGDVNPNAETLSQPVRDAATRVVEMVAEEVELLAGTAASAG